MAKKSKIKKTKIKKTRSPSNKSKASKVKKLINLVKSKKKRGKKK